MQDRRHCLPAVSWRSIPRDLNVGSDYTGLRALPPGCVLEVNTSYARMWNLSPTQVKTRRIRGVKQRRDRQHFRWGSIPLWCECGVEAGPPALPLGCPRGRYL
eukprot:1562445-Pyramimonas_sp.AAC.1